MFTQTFWWKGFNRLQIKSFSVIYPAHPIDVVCMVVQLIGQSIGQGLGGDGLRVEVLWEQVLRGPGAPVL